MNRCDRIIRLFERYAELINTAVDSNVYTAEVVQEIKGLTQEKEYLTEELINHGCRRKK